jgi:hypothetical protein
MNSPSDSSDDSADISNTDSNLPSTRQLVVAILGTLWGVLGLAYWGIRRLLNEADQPVAPSDGAYSIGEWTGLVVLFLLFAIGSITLADYYSRYRQRSKRMSVGEVADEDDSEPSMAEETEGAVEFFPARTGCFALLILCSVAAVGVAIYGMFKVR